MEFKQGVQDCTTNNPLPPRALQWESARTQQKQRRRNGFAILMFIISICFMAYLVLFLMGLGGKGYGFRIYSLCNTPPTNTFQGFVTINVYLFESLTFSTAKLIDVVGNLVIGQGGRAVHAWAALHIFSDACTRILESEQATCELYLAAKLNPISFWSGITFAKCVSIVSSARYRWLMVWFTFATLHVLAFPTLFSATTGYFSPSKEIWAIPGGAYLDKLDLVWDHGFDRLATKCIIIQNGPKVNLPVNTTILPGEDDYIDSQWTLGYEGDYRDPRYDSGPYKFVNTSLSMETQLWRNLSIYLYVHTQRQRTVDIEMNKFSNDSVFWINGVNLGSGTDSLTCRQTNCWNGTSVEPERKCLSQDGYVYGISTCLAFVFVALETIWIIGMFGVWWDANTYSEFNRKGWRRNGVLRTIAEFMEVLNADIGPTSCSYSDDELNEVVKREKIGYYMMYTDDDNVKHIGLSSSQKTSVRLEQGVLYG